MAYEDISGIRVRDTDYVAGAIGAASTVQHPSTRVIMHKPFTLKSVAVYGSTTWPAGTSMAVRIWVNDVRKGVGTITLTAGGGAAVNVGNNFAITGPANSVLGLSVAAVGGTAGTGARYQYRYYHGHGS